MIVTEETPDIDVILLNHGKVNAMDLELLEELSRQMTSSRLRNKAVLLTGKGSCLSAGVDLFRVVSGGKPYLEKFLPALSRVFLEFFTHPRPVVAAINGPAIAGGCILALCCDWRIATEEAKIGASELLVGVPFPAAPLEILRYGAASCFEELAYTGNWFAGNEALRRGLVQELGSRDSLHDAALRQLQKMAKIPAEVYAATKMELRAPAMARIEQRANQVDSTVAKAWASDATLTTIQRYLDSLRR